MFRKYLRANEELNGWQGAGRLLRQLANKVMAVAVIVTYALPPQAGELICGGDIASGWAESYCRYRLSMPRCNQPSLQVESDKLEWRFSIRDSDHNISPHEFIFTPPGFLHLGHLSLHHHLLTFQLLTRITVFFAVGRYLTDDVSFTSPVPSASLLTVTDQPIRHCKESLIECMSRIVPIPFFGPES